MITIMAYYNKYVIENQQGINQYHKILLKDKKECHTQYFHSPKPWILTIISMPITKVNDTQIHQCTRIDNTYQCKSRKSVKHKF